MKNCRDIENLLPLYSEGLLSEADQRAVEEHLAVCAPCRKEMAYLQEAGRLVEQLPQIEEPPWFRQKIMARVREEAERKDTAKKWFGPLKIRIPVQIAAAVVIAVLAVYLYRSGDDEMRRILPGVSKPSSMQAVQKEKRPADWAQPGKETIGRAVVKKEAVMPKEAQKEPKSAPSDDRIVSEDVASTGETGEADSSEARGLAESQEETAVPLKVGQNEMEAVKGQKADVPAPKRGGRSYKKAAPAAARSGKTAVSVSPQFRVLLRAADPALAAADVEKILARYSARKVTTQSLDGKMHLRAEISGRHWKDVLIQLEAVGRVEEKVEPFESDEQPLQVLIEVTDGKE